MLRFVIAHEGGWDEFLMFAVPVALGVWALRHVERKARRRAEAEERALADQPVESASTGDQTDQA